MTFTLTLAREAVAAGKSVLSAETEAAGIGGAAGNRVFMRLKIPAGRQRLP